MRSARQKSYSKQSCLSNKIEVLMRGNGERSHYVACNHQFLTLTKISEKATDPKSKLRCMGAFSVRK